MTHDISIYQLFEAPVKLWAKGKARPLRIEKSIPFSLPVADIVLSAKGMDQFYFGDSHNRYEKGGIGCACEYIDEDADRPAVVGIEGLWAKNPMYTLFGGMSFFDEPAPPEWQSFGRFRFVLPLLEISRDKDGSKVVLNYLPAENISMDFIKDDILTRLQQIDALRKSRRYVSAAPSFVETLVPGYEKWYSLVEEALAWLNENGIRKVVLSRKKIFKSEVSWDPAFLFQGIEKIKENSFLFFCRQKNGAAFLGRSPERLFKLSKGFLTSDAIAGTRQRSDSLDDDERLAAELMASVKDIEEHRIVVEYIYRRMGQLCVDVALDASPEPLKLMHLQHIITRVRGRLKNGCHPADIMRILHPTPAVGGVPPESSREMILRLEPFKRGWYAAPIGWMSKDAAEFAVGIRSALVCDKELHLFGGAGIVAKSNPDLEWEETGHKMANFTRILGEPLETKD
jgi:menaquinone-specific isochorismate synthase